ncbi:MAG TPA: diaminopimelate decarboxylase [Candidatus Dormibacteraeota bacterium]
MLLPVTYRVGARGRMEVGGCDLLEVARRYGTPLYVYDEETVRTIAREFIAAMGPAGHVLYSAKAFASPQFLRVISEEGLGLDVVSAGELHLALRSGFPAQSIYFLGNNKSREDLEAAWRAGATLVVDGFQEFDLLREVVPAGQRMRAEVRLSPGVRPDTHEYIATGQLDSKFGFSVESGAARLAVELALAHDRLELVGLHSHLGSQIFDLRGHAAAMAIMLDLVAELRRDLGFSPRRLGAGGGLGIAYTHEDDPPTPREFVTTLRAALDGGCAERGLPVPELVVEPGRSLAGPAGIALYTVGAIKEIPGVRTYVAVDGGMGDNIRPKLYDARYEAIKVDDPEPADAGLRTVTIAGKYCESADILVSDARLPPLRAGDVLALPAAGAYCLAMASNYNGMPRPAVVMVRDGEARLIRRRETLDDLLLTEIF